MSKLRTNLRYMVVALLMLILPVQGFAAAYAPMHKALGAQASVAMPCHEPAPQQTQHASHAAAAPSTDATDNGAPGATHGTDSASHQCCQQVFTGATSSAWPIAAHKFSDVSRSIVPLATLFIPDSPDRPPRG